MRCSFCFALVTDAARQVKLWVSKLGTRPDLIMLVCYNKLCNEKANDKEAITRISS